MHRIHTEKFTIAEKQSIWKEILAEFENSNLSQSKFCRDYGIKLDLFNYHYRKHRQGLQKQMPTFVPVTIEPPKIAHYIHLKWREIGIDFPVQADLNQLLALIKSLGALSC